MTSYLLGLATLPAVLVVAGLGWLLHGLARTWLRGSGEERPERCSWGCRAVLARPGWTEPRALWELRRHRAFARHMREAETCRAKCNRWLEATGRPVRWTSKGKVRA